MLSLSDVKNINQRGTQSLQTTSLKMKNIWGCGVRKKWAHQTSVARSSSLFEATLGESPTKLLAVELYCWSCRPHSWTRKTNAADADFDPFFKLSMLSPTVLKYSFKNVVSLQEHTRSSLPARTGTNGFLWSRKPLQPNNYTSGVVKSVSNLSMILALTWFFKTGLNDLKSTLSALRGNIWEVAV